MSRNNKEYFVIDLEMTCEEKREKGYKPEIIEIGLIKINTKGEITHKEQLFIKPQFNKISEYCTNLTGYDFPFLKSNGRTFKQACNRLKNLGTRNKIIIAWGDDWKQFEMECKWKNVDFPLSGQYMDLSMMHSMLNQTSKKYSLKEAMEFYDVKAEGKAHTGLDDAFNTTQIFQKMLTKINF